MSGTVQNERKVFETVKDLVAEANVKTPRELKKLLQFKAKTAAMKQVARELDLNEIVAIAQTLFEDGVFGCKEKAKERFPEPSPVLADAVVTPDVDVTITVRTLSCFVGEPEQYTDSEKEDPTPGSENEDEESGASVVVNPRKYQSLPMSNFK